MNERGKGEGEREREREYNTYFVATSPQCHSHDSSNIFTVTGDSEHLALLNQRFGNSSVAIVVQSEALLQAEVLVSDPLRSIAINEPVPLRGER